MLVYFALGDASFSPFLPDAKPKICVTPDASQWNIGGVGSWCWVFALGPGVGSLRWACTFHALGDANSTRRKPGFWWNMGLSLHSTPVRPSDNTSVL